MNGMPSKTMIEALKRRYPEGQRVELISMDDPFASEPRPGEQGTVVFVDSIGTVHINWDCGSSLGAVHGVDIIAPISE